MEGLFQEDNVVLILMDETNVKSVLKDIADEIKDHERVCVFSIAKQAKSVSADLVAAGLDARKLHFIDAVSKCKGIDSCYPVDNPGLLTDLGIGYSRALKEGKCDAAIFPAISLMSSYVPYKTLVRFLATLAEKTRSYDAHLVIATLWEEQEHQGLHDAFVFMDRIIDRRVKK